MEHVGLRMEALYVRAVLLKRNAVPWRAGAVPPPIIAVSDGRSSFEVSGELC
jgi:hypothetical protein